MDNFQSPTSRREHPTTNIQWQIEMAWKSGRGLPHSRTLRAFSGWRAGRRRPGLCRVVSAAPDPGGVGVHDHQGRHWCQCLNLPDGEPALRDLYWEGRWLLPSPDRRSRPGRSIPVAPAAYTWVCFTGRFAWIFLATMVGGADGGDEADADNDGGLCFCPCHNFQCSFDGG